MQLVVDLQEGFEGEELLIRVPGRDPVRLTGVRTRMQTGLAHSLSFALDAAADGRTLGLEVPALALSRTVTLPDAPAAWLGVSLARGRDALEVRLQDTPFGYL